MYIYPVDTDQFMELATKVSEGVLKDGSYIYERAAALVAEMEFLGQCNDFDGVLDVAATIEEEMKELREYKTYGFDVTLEGGGRVSVGILARSRADSIALMLSEGEGILGGQIEFFVLKGSKEL